ncbi:MAG: hypothetical protein OXN89_06910 [Bryobacterales bacterium]|nr:hypothetical protein [Bryobacterales bacterium]
MTYYEWAMTRQVRWLILLLLVILIAILVINAVSPPQRWMRFKEEFWTGDRVLVALARRDREAAIWLAYERRTGREIAMLRRASQVARRASKVGKDVCNFAPVDLSGLDRPSRKTIALDRASRLIDCARAHGIPVPPLNPSWPYEAWRATMKFACERKSPACPWWRRVLSNVGIVTW